MGLWLAVLGEVDAQVDGESIDLGHARQRCVFLVLLFDANRVVPADRLIERVWGDNAPKSVRSTLYGYLHHLRKVLPAGCGASIERRSGGYLLTVDPMSVDVHRFTDLIDQARDSSNGRDALALYDQALALWRGEPFADLDTPWLETVRAGLERDRLRAERDRADLALEHGRHAELATSLPELVDAWPTDERLVAQLMSALHRGGRRSEALTVYERLRVCLAEELDTEPGTTLRNLRDRILLEEGPSAPKPSGVAAHRQLPMDIAEFTGRTAELRQLDELASVASWPTIVVITGMAGVGKTRLAVHAAHRLIAGGRFDEIQLWSNLHGFDGEHPPADPAAVLEGFLRLLDVPGERIPQDLESRATLYRDRLAGRRALVLLDNAVSEEQVRHLLPGTGGTLVLVTSRRTLTSLDGARTLPLDVLSPAESVAMLARVAGEGRVAAEPDAAARVGELCGHLPIAVVLAARRLRSRAAWRVADLAERLARDDRRLDGLTSGTRLLHTVFELSYRALSPPLRRMFRLLSLHVGDDLTADAAAALYGCSPEEAEGFLEELLDEHLLQQTSADRYRFHDLMLAYARDRADAEDPPADREAAIHRLVTWFLHAAESARGMLDPNRVRIIDLPPVPASVPRFTGYDEAAQWFEREQVALLGAVRAAHECGAPTVAWQLAWVLLSFYYPRSQWDDWIVAYRTGLAAAQGSGDRRGEGVMWRGLGVVYSDLRRFDAASDCHQRAQEIMEEVGDLHGQAWNLNNLGVVHVDLDELAEAATCFRRALPVFRHTGDRQGEGFALNNLGDVCLRLGQRKEAASYLRQAMLVQRDTDDQGGLQFTLSTLADLHREAGQHGEAVEYYRQALELSRPLGHLRTTARTLANLGRTHDLMGEPDVAITHWRAAHDIFTELGDPQAAEIRARLT